MGTTLVAKYSIGWTKQSESCIEAKEFSFRLLAEFLQVLISTILR